MTRLRALLLALALACAVAVAAASTGPFLEPDREVAPFQLRGERRLPSPTVSPTPFREDEPVEIPRVLRAFGNVFDALFRWLAIAVAVAVLLWGLYLLARAVAELVRLRRRRADRAVGTGEYDDGEGSGQDADTALRRRVADDLRLLSADLDALADPREAVIACYVRMEHALAAAGSPRGATETPLELLSRVLDSYDVPPADVRRLTDLFTEARFSSHPVTDEMRAAARRSLASVADALAVRT